MCQLLESIKRVSSDLRQQQQQTTAAASAATNPSVSSRVSKLIDQLDSLPSIVPPVLPCSDYVEDFLAKLRRRLKVLDEVTRAVKLGRTAEMTQLRLDVNEIIGELDQLVILTTFIICITLMCPLVLSLAGVAQVGAGCNSIARHRTQVAASRASDRAADPGE